MLFIHGRKKVYRKLGHVADFCPICRTPSPFLLERVGMARHFYYISFGQGKLVGHKRTCEKCQTSFGAQLKTYASVRKKTAPVAELKRETFPNLEEVWAERLALEEQVRRASWQLSRTERMALIRDPFLLLAPRVEKYYTAKPIDARVFLSVLAAIGLLLGGGVLALEFVPDQFEMALAGLIGTGLSLILWQAAGADRRYLRQEVVPLLVRALRPLRPTPDELTAVLDGLETKQQRIGTKLNWNDLKAHLPSLRA